MVRTDSAALSSVLFAAEISNVTVIMTCRSLLSGGSDDQSTTLTLFDVMFNNSTSPCRMVSMSWLVTLVVLVKLSTNGTVEGHSTLVSEVSMSSA